MFPKIRGTFFGGPCNKDPTTTRVLYWDPLFPGTPIRPQPKTVSPGARLPLNRKTKKYASLLQVSGFRASK